MQSWEIEALLGTCRRKHALNKGFAIVYEYAGHIDRTKALLDRHVRNSNELLDRLTHSSDIDPVPLTVQETARLLSSLVEINLDLLREICSWRRLQWSPRPILVRPLEVEGVSSSQSEKKTTLQARLRIQTQLLLPLLNEDVLSLISPFILSAFLATNFTFEQTRSSFTTKCDARGLFVTEQIFVATRNVLFLEDGVASTFRQLHPKGHSRESEPYRAFPVLRLFYEGLNFPADNFKWFWESEPVYRMSADALFFNTGKVQLNESNPNTHFGPSEGNRYFGGDVLVHDSNSQYGRQGPNPDSPLSRFLDGVSPGQGHFLRCDASLEDVSYINTPFDMAQFVEAPLFPMSLSEVRAEAPQDFNFGRGVLMDMGSLAESPGLPESNSYQEKGHDKQRETDGEWRIRTPLHDSHQKLEEQKDLFRDIVFPHILSEKMPEGEYEKTEEHAMDFSRQTGCESLLADTLTEKERVHPVLRWSENISLGGQEHVETTSSVSASHASSPFSIPSQTNNESSNTVPVRLLRKKSAGTRATLLGNSSSRGSSGAGAAQMRQDLGVEQVRRLLYASKKFCATLIQCLVRSYLARRRMRRLRVTTHNARRRQFQRECIADSRHGKHAAATMIQMRIRGMLGRLRVVRMIGAGLVINKVFRKYLSYINLRKYLRRIERPCRVKVGVLEDLPASVYNSSLTIRVKVSLFWSPLLHIADPSDVKRIVDLHLPQFCIYTRLVTPIPTDEGATNELNVLQTTATPLPKGSATTPDQDPTQLNHLSSKKLSEGNGTGEAKRKSILAKISGIGTSKIKGGWGDAEESSDSDEDADRVTLPSLLKDIKARMMSQKFSNLLGSSAKLLRQPIAHNKTCFATIDETIRVSACHGNSVFRLDLVDEGSKTLASGYISLSSYGSLMMWDEQITVPLYFSAQRKSRVSNAFMHNSAEDRERDRDRDREKNRGARHNSLSALLGNIGPCTSGPRVTVSLCTGTPLNSRCSWAKVKLLTRGPLSRALKQSHHGNRAVPEGFSDIFAPDWRRVFISLDGEQFGIYDNKGNNQPVVNFLARDIVSIGVEKGTMLKAFRSAHLSYDTHDFSIGVKREDGRGVEPLTLR